MLSDCREDTSTCQSRKVLVPFCKAGSRKRITTEVTYVHAVVILISTSTNIIWSVLPFVSEKVHGNYALLLTTRQLCSLLGSVLYGKAVESWGFRLPFATTAVATLLMCTLVSLSSSAEVLLLSHLLTILLQTYTGALMFITEVTNKTDRADALGKLGVSYGLGMAVGPYIGGYFSTHYSEQFASGVAGTGCIIAIAIIWMFVPKSTGRIQANNVDVTKDHMGDEAGGVNLKTSLSLLSAPSVAMVVTVRVAVAIPRVVWQSMYPVVNIARFGLTAEYNGYFMSYNGVLAILMQGFGIKVMIKVITDTFLLKLSVTILTAGYCMLMMSISFWSVSLCQMLIVPWEGAVDIVTNYLVSKMVEKKHIKSVLSLSLAADGIVQLFLPTVGASIYSLFGFEGLGALGFGINGLTTVFLIWYLQ